MFTKFSIEHHFISAARRSKLGKCKFFWHSAKDAREPSVLSVIGDSDLDLSNLGLEEVFMTNTESKVEENDVLHPKQPPPPPPIFPLPPFIPDNQKRLTYSPTTDSKHLLTIDNAPPSRWHDEIFNMYSWCIAKLQAPNATVAQIIAKFVARVTGRLREWWINLGEYRQRQAAQCNTLEDFFMIIHNEFLSSPTHFTEVSWEEFLQMKCYSFETKDLKNILTKCQGDITLLMEWMMLIPSIPFSTPFQNH